MQSALTPTWQTFFSLDRPGKIVCVGLNYHDHADESGMRVPAEPLLFGKFPNTLVGTGEPIVLPPTSEHVDGEAELAVVIGATAHNVDCGDAMDYVFGFTVANDVSARDLQFGTASGSAAKASTRSVPSCRRSCRAARSPIRTTCTSCSA